MIENIVERLRHPEGYIDWEHSRVMDEAAAEIERLRAAGDALFRLIVDDIEWDTEEEDEIAERILHEWEEARRG